MTGNSCMLMSCIKVSFYCCGFFACARRSGRVRYLLALLTCLVLATGTTQAQSGRVDARLSQSTVSLGESVTLTVVANDVEGDLDVSSLEADFEVVGRSSSSQVNIINGKRSEIRSWVVEIMPLDEGVYTIPAVRVGVADTPLLRLNVNPAPTGSHRELFVEVSVDYDQPYVQAQVMLSVKVFQAVNVIDGSLGSPRVDGADVIALDDNRVTDEQRDGRTYRVLERRYAVFAQQSGPLTIEPMILSVSVPADPQAVQGFFAPRRKLVRRSEPVKLDVQPRPRDVATAWWLPAADLGLREQWDGELDDVTVGQPVTRRITLRAMGVNSTQLPELDLPEVEGLSIYSDADSVSTTQDEYGITSIKEFSWAYIPEQVGDMTLPEVRVEWFNTLDGTSEVAVLPARKLTVKPDNFTTNATSTEAVGPSTDGDEPSPSPDTDAIAEADPASKPAADSSLSTVEPDAVGGQGGEASSMALATDAVSETKTQTAQNTSPEPNPDTTTDATAPLVVPSSPTVDNLGPKSPQVWRWLAVVALLGWGITGVLLILARRSRQAGEATVTPATRGLSFGGLRSATGMGPAALADMKAACRANDINAVQKSVLAWAADIWPENPPRHCRELITRLQHETRDDASTGAEQHGVLAAVERKLALMDAALYRPVTQSRGANQDGRRVATETIDPAMAELKTLPDALQAFLEGRKPVSSSQSQLPDL